MTSSNDTSKINLTTAIIIGMNAMIGAGIFAAPAAIAFSVGPAGILLYICVVLAVLFVALGLAHLASLFPEEGSFYVYASQWGGHITGLIASWAYVVGLVTAMGLLTQVAGLYLQPLFPSYSPYTLGLVSLLALTVLNMVGVTLSEIGQKILIVCTTFPIIVTIIICFSKANLSLLTPFAPHGFSNILSATRSVIFGFFGFECAASLFTIVRNPGKNVPRAITYAVILVGILYTLFVASLIISTPLHFFTAPHMLLPEILQVTFPDNTWLLRAIHLSILSAIFGTLHSMIWSLSTLLIALTHKFKNRTVRTLTAQISPRMAVLLVGIAIFITFSVIKNMDLFFSLTNLGVVSAFLLSMITLLTIKKERTISTFLGILAACIILGFAFEGVIREIHKLMY
jgi:APA family basic amino acid/polyamine antiporter